MAGLASRERAASLGLHSRGPHFSECARLLEAKDAEIRYLKCHLEELYQQHLSGTGEHLAEVFRSHHRSRSRVEDLASKQRQQLQVAQEAAKAAEQRRDIAVESSSQAKERLGQVGARVRGVEQRSKEIQELMEQECAREAEASRALGTAERQEVEVQQEIGTLRRRMEEAAAEESSLQHQLASIKEHGRDAERSANDQLVTQEEQEEACLRTAERLAKTCQQLAAEHEALQEKLQSRRVELQQVSEEQEAATGHFARELEVLETARLTVPAEMQAALAEKHKERETLQSEVSQTEFELRAALRQRAEQQRKMTAAVAKCRREVDSKEAKARSNAAQCLKRAEAECEEAQSALNGLQFKVRQRKTKQRVGLAFKAPLLQQRSGNLPSAEAKPESLETRRVASVLQRCSALRNEEFQQLRELGFQQAEKQLVASELQELRQAAGSLPGEDDQHENLASQLAHWSDLADRLRREEVWLAEECQNTQAQSEARGCSQMQALQQLQEELRCAEGS